GHDRRHEERLRDFDADPEDADTRAAFLAVAGRGLLTCFAANAPATCHRTIFGSASSTWPIAIFGARCCFARPMIAAPLMVLAAVIITGPRIGARYTSSISSIRSSRSAGARFAIVRIAFHRSTLFSLPSSPAKISKCG